MALNLIRNQLQSTKKEKHIDYLITILTFVTTKHAWNEALRNWLGPSCQQKNRFRKMSRTSQIKLCYSQNQSQLLPKQSITLSKFDTFFAKTELFSKKSRTGKISPNFFFLKNGCCKNSAHAWSQPSPESFKLNWPATGWGSRSLGSPSRASPPRDPSASRTSPPTSSAWPSSSPDIPGKRGTR